MTILRRSTMAGKLSSDRQIKTWSSDAPHVITNPSTPTTQKTSKLSVDVETVVKGNNTFALDLYHQLRNRERNLFFSPYSISTALAMTYAGARGQTATEMSKVLRFTLEQESLHLAFAALMANLHAEKQQGFQLRIANRLWGQQGYGFLNTFVQLTQDNYGAALEEVDFIQSTEEAPCSINNWVEQQTQQKIQELIAPGILDSLTKLVLTNAIYFKGAWVRQFDPAITRNGPFTVAPGQQVEVPMMFQKSQHLYAELGNLQVLELSYVSEETSMVILLPKKVDGLVKLEQQLKPKNLEKWLSSISLSRGEVTVGLPKFRVTSEFELSQVLSKLGMALAFENADFSGMTGKKELFISKVIHKTFVDVNEFGTEAAAATAVCMFKSKAAVSFVADRPFIFLIRDRHSGSILFLGRVVNPVASPEP